VSNDFAKFTRYRLHRNRGTVFSVRYSSECYKHGRRICPEVKNLSTEAQNTVGIRHQEKADENKTDLKGSVLAVVSCRMWDLAIALHLKLKITELRGLSAQANYTDRATVACQLS
jgi:hypothetical protein